MHASAQLRPSLLRPPRFAPDAPQGAGDPCSCKAKKQKTQVAAIGLGRLTAGPQGMPTKLNGRSPCAIPAPTPCRASTLLATQALQGSAPAPALTYNRQKASWALQGTAVRVDSSGKLRMPTVQAKTWRELPQLGWHTMQLPWCGHSACCGKQTKCSTSPAACAHRLLWCPCPASVLTGSFTPS